MKYGTETAEHSSALFVPIQKLSKTSKVNSPKLSVKIEPNVTQKNPSKETSMSYV